MSDKRNPIEFNTDEKVTSLDWKPNDRRPKGGIGTGPSSPDIAGDTAREYLKKKSIETIRIKIIENALGEEIVQIKDPGLLKELIKIAGQGLARINDPPTLSKVMRKIDAVLEGEPKWVRFFVSKSVRYGWIGARHTFSKFSAIEKILDGAQDKEIDEVAKGMVEFALGGILTTILFKVIER